MIIFTEYCATQDWLFNVLAHRGFGTDDKNPDTRRLLQMYGAMDRDAREDVQATCQASPADSQMRILLATDAASEGLDLQNHCSKLIHIEIPWNPNRLEQRNGRIDRHGQRQPQVLIHHFVPAGYGERMKKEAYLPPGDLDGELEFLARAARKVNQIREYLGSVGSVIAEQVEAALLHGTRTTLETSKAEQEASNIRAILKFERDLRRRVDELMERYRSTKSELRLEPENIHRVVEVGLQLAGQPPLEPVKKADGLLRLPALKGSWGACAEGLEHPYTGEVRSITFDPSHAKGNDKVVLVHLNHRLVQMCLRLLRAEVWASGGREQLRRMTARLIPDHASKTGRPAIIAHARLVVIGGDSRRVHEEIFAAGGTFDLSAKPGTKKYFTPLGVNETADLLRAATNDEPSATTQDVLREHWPRLRPELQTAITARADQLMHGREGNSGLAKTLNERAKKDSDSIESILSELQRTIAQALQTKPDRTLFDGLDGEDNRDQYERNKHQMQRRLEQIPIEIEREQAAILARFTDLRLRTFPVAVTNLVPQGLGRPGNAGHVL